MLSESKGPFQVAPVSLHWCVCKWTSWSLFYFSSSISLTALCLVLKQQLQQLHSASRPSFIFYGEWGRWRVAGRYSSSDTVMQEGEVRPLEREGETRGRGPLTAVRGQWRRGHVIPPRLGLSLALRWKRGGRRVEFKYSLSQHLPSDVRPQEDLFHTLLVSPCHPATAAVETDAFIESRFGSG